MPSHTLEIDPHALTLTVRDPGLFTAAWMVVSNLGIGALAKQGEWLLIRCVNGDDLSLLVSMLGESSEVIHVRP